MSAVKVGEDSVGVIMRNDEGWAFYATPCCGATAKGCDGYIGCRACYAEVDPSLGDTPPVEYFDAKYHESLRRTEEFLAEVTRRSLGQT